MPLLGQQFLARCKTRQQAYNLLQVRLMQRFQAQGGSPEEFIDRLAPIYSQRYHWMLEA